MRALLGCFLVLSLAVSPAIAGTNGSEDTKAASTASTSTTTAAPAAKSTPAATTAAKPAASSMETELNELRDQMDSQSRQIQEQNDLLKAEQEKMKTLEQQLKTANSSSASLNASAAAAPGSGSSSSATVASASVPAASSPSSQPAPAAQAAAAPEPLYFKIGGAQFTPGGFIDVMNVWRSTDNGGGLGSSFGGVLYPIAANYPAVGSSEDRFSLQNSRVTLRVDGNVAGGKAVGYLEADFLGNAAGTIFVTSNSSTLRMRLYFLDYTRGKFEFLGGQDWGMLVSNRTGIGFMPGDIFYSSDVDTNYQLGLVWQRTAQVRFLYHFSKTAVAGISLENPEQYIGSGLVNLPSGTNLANNFDANGGTGGSTNTPNLVPDIVAKIAFDPMLGKLHEHIEVAGIARTFRVNTFTAATGTTPQSSVNRKTEGGGIAVNSNWEIFKNFHIIENAFWSDGDGRDIIGLAPDLVVRPLLPATAGSVPAYTVSPVHSGSFIAGFEYTHKNTLLYGYTSGVYVQKNFVAVGGSNCLATGVTCYGYGNPVASAATAESDNRYMQEHTLGVTQTLWRNPQYGAIQFYVQASYVGREPWWVVPASPRIAHLGMAYVDLRYTLP